MKKYPFFIFLVITIAYDLPAQFRIGIRGGINTLIVDNAKPLSVLDELGNQILQLNLDKTKVGPTGGLVLQLSLGNFTIQPEILYSSSTVEYDLTTPTLPEDEQNIRREKYQYLDIPLLLGFKLGPLRLQGGPEGHLYLNNVSDLTDIDFYRQNFDEFVFGWAAGLGIDIWNLMVDFRLEGSFKNFGEHFVFNGTQFNFDDRPRRWVITIGFYFN